MGNIDCGIINSFLIYHFTPSCAALYLAEILLNQRGLFISIILNTPFSEQPWLSHTYQRLGLTVCIERINGT